MLDALGNLGDFIGGIAVVVTLIYLAYQVRQNTLALRTASRQEIVAGMREHNRLFVDRDMNDALLIGLRKYPDIPAAQADLFRTGMNDLALFFQGTFALHEAGTLEDETYEAYLRFVAAMIATPGGTAWWERVGPIYTPRMAAAIGARLDRGDLPDLLSGGIYGRLPEA